MTQTISIYKCAMHSTINDDLILHTDHEARHCGSSQYTQTREGAPLVYNCKFNYGFPTDILGDWKLLNSFLTDILGDSGNC